MARLRGQLLANPANPAFVLPERLARTDAYKPIQDATGSGPFRFKADEFASGSFAAYERNVSYRPVGAGEPSLTAGPKIVSFDRVEWRTIPDPATTAAALHRGEVDWYENPTPEQIEAFQRNPAITLLPRNLASCDASASQAACDCNFRGVGARDPVMISLWTESRYHCHAIPGARRVPS